MIITPKLLSIPPYISTGWEHVAALRTDGPVVIVHLTSGEQAHIPNLSQQEIETIYAAHAAFLQDNTSQQLIQKQEAPLQFGMAFGNEFGNGIGTLMQHDPSQANSPDLPEEILSRIGEITKVIAPDDLGALPKPVPNCNCVHCQIAKAIAKALGTVTEDALLESENESDEIVPDSELNFCQWDIVQSGDKLYTVINRLDTKERYSVYLGHPVGCTCGKEGCDHVLAVLRN